MRTPCPSPATSAALHVPLADPGDGRGRRPVRSSPSPPTTPPTTPAPKPTGTAKLTAVGAKQLTATAGETFSGSPKVRAVDAEGKPVAAARVKYEIRGETSARFLGLVRSVTVLTGPDGTATAPKLLAGEQPGSFTLRATAVGREQVAPVDFAATVKPRPVPQADALARLGDGVLKTGTGGSFADLLTVKATNKGKVAAGVPVTATMITDAKKPEVNDKGPYFLDAKDKPVRTLTGLKTNALGQLTLPKILTDEHAGTYLLRLTTADGAVLDVELTVDPGRRRLAAAAPGTPRAAPEPPRARGRRVRVAWPSCSHLRRPLLRCPAPAELTPVSSAPYRNHGRPACAPSPPPRSDSPPPSPSSSR